MDVPHISLNMIVRDSASTIKRAIQSVKNFVDEIIIVDTGSTDNTVEIAKELGAKVYFFEWIDDYSAARNFAIEKSTGDWIIWLDDDEWIDEENSKKLCALHLSKDCFYTVTKVVERNQKFYSLQTSSPRIFPNRADIRWELRVHETIRESLEKAGLTEEIIDVDLINDGFETDRTQKTLYYKKLLEEDLKKNPHDPHILYHLAQECKAAKLFEEAAKYYGDSILYFPDGAIYYLREAIPNYIQMLIESRQIPKAVQVVLQGREIFPKSPRLIDLHATLERFIGSKDLAEKLWLELIEVSKSPEMEHDMLHPIGVRLAGLDRLGNLYLEEGRIGEARECWNKALALDPENLPALEGLKKINRTG